MAHQAGYNIHGIQRLNSNFKNHNDLSSLKHLNMIEKINFHQVDLMDTSKISNLLSEIKPTYFAHLGSQSNVQKSYNNKNLTMESNFVLSKNIINVIKNISKETIIFFPSSATIYEGYKNTTVNEQTLPKPKTNYSKSKYLTQEYIKKSVEEDEMQINTGIMFSHESALRKSEFFSKKIVSFLVNYKKTNISELRVGDLSIERDIGYAPDFVNAIFKIMQQNDKDEYIVSTNSLTKLSYFVETCLNILEIDYEVEVNGSELNYIDIKNNFKFITSSKDKYRKFDLRGVKGDNSKIQTNLGWKPTKTVENICKIMINHELNNE